MVLRQVLLNQVDAQDAVVVLRHQRNVDVNRSSQDLWILANRTVWQAQHINRVILLFYWNIIALHFDYGDGGGLDELETRKPVRASIFLQLKCLEDFAEQDI